MKKLASSLFLATAMLTGASAAGAAQIEHSTPLTFNGSTSDFGASFATGTTGQSFLEKFTFSSAHPFSLSSALISIGLGSLSSLDIGSVTLNGNGGVYNGVKSTIGGIQYFTLNTANLAAGNYTLAVAGVVTGLRGGSFGGNVSVAAVPEASTVVMLLSGLALVGGVAWRRRKSVQPTETPELAAA